MPGRKPRAATPVACLALITLGAATGIDAALAAVRPTVPALIRSARSGAWSSPTTWEGGRVPGRGAKVQIRSGHTVRYDLSSDQPLRSIHVAGTLTFAQDRDTRLDIGLLKIQPGGDASENGFDCDAHLPAADPSHRPVLEVGTAEHPVPAGHTARIRLAYLEGMDRQSCPGIVCCGGRMEFHGAPMSRTWVKLGATANAGDSQITLAEPVTGWRVGDHLILTATQREGTGSVSGTFRPSFRPAGDVAPSVPLTSTTRAAAAAREAGLLAAIATKFAGGPGRGKGPAGSPAGEQTPAAILAGARVTLWAAETAQQRRAPGKEAAVAGVVAARTALAVAEAASRQDASDRASAAVTAAQTALSAAAAALTRNAPNREAIDASLRAARAAVAAAEASGVQTTPGQVDALRSSMLEFLAGAKRRHSLPAFAEARVIKAIDGTTLTLDRPLQFPHRAAGDYRGEVADLSRNVIIESADPAGVRGHTMYHRGSQGSISYAEFRHLGKEGVLGRYSLHFHLVGNSMRGSSVVGASIWDSGNRWLTIHGTNYLVVRDCVGYQSVGHGFYLEDGSEVYNVFDRNLAVQAYRGEPLPKQNLPFDMNDGAGFWWANSLNTFTRNVACECDGYGYRFEATPSDGFDLRRPVQRPDGTIRTVDIRTLPFVRFEENEAHSILYGLNLGEGVDNVGPDLRHPFVVRNNRFWNAQWAFRPDAPSMVVDGMEIYDSRYGFFLPIFDHHAYRRLAINETELPGTDGFVPLGRRPEGLAFPDPEDGRAALIKAALKQYLVKDASDAGTRGAADPVPAGKAGAGVARDPAEVKRALVLKAGDPLSAPPSGPANDGLSSVRFPQPLDPADDLPPATVITFVGTPVHGRVIVRGTTADNGTVKQVRVNGRAARPMGPNFAEWEITLDHVRPGMLKLTAYAEDAAGNEEKLPHRLSVIVPQTPASGTGT